ncbi:MAG TPA: 50S ribosomal protein L2 [Candidatus Woesearchaeota archaeon]|nr:MAG: 50S ribosomal protein L2 [Candidatus Woesearchaeota archaeon]HDD70640.1 50S ribosomal protein L2 [Candidatus Woesearchaeota archaeon]
MGKRIIQQARGKGGPRYRSPGFKFLGDIKYRSLDFMGVKGVVRDFAKCPGHLSPLAAVEFEDGFRAFMIAPEGIRTGEVISFGGDEIKSGNVLFLKDIPEGTEVFNIESSPGDGGKFCRTSGMNAKIVSKTDKNVVVLLPSKKKRVFSLKCRATIGIVSGGGRHEKPFLKAGNKFYARKARNKLYPLTHASAMNAVDHPFGNKRTSRKAKQKGASKLAPPGRKVGKLWPKRTGKRN